MVQQLDGRLPGGLLGMRIELKSKRVVFYLSNIFRGVIDMVRDASETGGKRTSAATNTSGALGKTSPDGIPNIIPNV